MSTYKFTNYEERIEELIDELRMNRNLICRPLCHIHLILAQQKQIKTWIELTVTMLENSIVLYNFTMVDSWINFSQTAARQKIGFFCEFLRVVNEDINRLTRVTVFGCNYCLRTNCLWI